MSDKIVPVDWESLSGDAVRSLPLAGRWNGLQPGSIHATYMPQGAVLPPPSEAGLDRMLCVLEGEITAETESGLVKVGASNGIYLPAGAPRTAVATAGPMRLLEVCVPAGGAATAVLGKPDLNGFGQGTEFDYRWLLNRDAGVSSMALNYLHVPPGKGGPELHVHAFDQFYYVVDGRMSLQIGLAEYTVGPDTFVFLPEGVIHRQWNEQDEAERHYSVLLPEPAKGAVFDYPVTLGEGIRLP